MECNLEPSALTTIVGIALAGALSQYLAWRIKFPAILFLLLSGILAGPITGLLDPDALFGDLLFPFISLSVAVILFEGSLTLKLEEIRGLERVVRRLVGPGSLISGLVSGLAAHLLAGFGWELAALFGALMVVTGPTVVVPMLRAIRPTASVGNVLRWEGIVIDPLGALLTVLVFEFIVALRGAGDLADVLVLFIELLLAGLVTGALAGYLFGVVLRRHWLPEYLHNLMALNLVLLIFVAANAMAEEAGLLAVTVMGIVMANMRQVAVADILDFKESLSILLVSALFVILAARIQPGAFPQLGWGAVGVFLAIQFIGRPLKVAFATAGSSLSWQERALIAWVGPRGIIAAGIAALLALRLAGAGIAQAELMVPLVFGIIIGTVVLQGVTAPYLARWLGVAEPEPKGLLIVGANRVARAVAKALNEQGFDTLLADGSRHNIRQARIEGLRTFYGNPVSERADRRLDLVGIGRMLGLSPDPDQNSLAAMRYRSELGAGAVYQLTSKAQKEGDRGKAIGPGHRGRDLFGPEVTYQELEELLRRGGRIRATNLTEQFDLGEFHRRYWKRGVPLFALDERLRLHIFTGDATLEPGPGWIILALVLPEDEPEQPGAEPAAAAESIPHA
jgi:CPA1 family monovalent cation:H+ antiporter